MNENRIYKKALEKIKDCIDLFGTVIDQTPEDMRFTYSMIQDAVNMALYAGRKQRKLRKGN